jgi:hypothetical protein
MAKNNPKSVLLIRIRVYLAVLWIRIRSAPKILAGSGPDTDQDKTIPDTSSFGSEINLNIITPKN